MDFESANLEFSSIIRGRAYIQFIAERTTLSSIRIGNILITLTSKNRKIKEENDLMKDWDVFKRALEEWEPLNQNPRDRYSTRFRVGRVFAKFELKNKRFYIFFSDRISYEQRNLGLNYSPNMTKKESFEQRIDELKIELNLYDIESNFMHDLCYLFGDYYYDAEWAFHFIKHNQRCLLDSKH